MRNLKIKGGKKRWNGNKQNLVIEVDRPGKNGNMEIKVSKGFCSNV